MRGLYTYQLICLFCRDYTTSYITWSLRWLNQLVIGLPVRETANQKMEAASSVICKTAKWRTELPEGFAGRRQVISGRLAKRFGS